MLVALIQNLAAASSMICCRSTLLVLGQLASVTYSFYISLCLLLELSENSDLPEQLPVDRA